MVKYLCGFSCMKIWYWYYSSQIINYLAKCISCCPRQIVCILREGKTKND